ncbi:AraC family transcriptional regulator [bacterium]|nr:MAG: AraC family transcriptional regulator [bacterium]
MPHLLPSFRLESNDEIDILDGEQKPLDSTEKSQNFILEQVPGWRAGGYVALDQNQSESFGSKPPLVVRRESYRGLDKNSYRHLDFWALYFVQRGYGTHVINKHPWSMARGNVYLLPPNFAHFNRGPMDVVLEAIYFGETLFSPDEQSALGELAGAAPLIAHLTDNDESEDGNHRTRLGHFMHLSPQQQIEVEATISHIRRDLSQQERAWHLSAKSRLWCLLVQLAQWRSEKPNSARSGESRELADVLHFCETHFSHPLTVEQLANMTHFSRTHFTRLFTLEVGMAPATYLRHLRLQHAQKLLRETRHSINDLAHLCGFSDPTTFTRAFQKSFGVSPLTYRRANKSTTKS